MSLETTDEVRAKRASKAAKQRLSEEGLCRMDGGPVYYERLDMDFDEELYPFEEGTDMSDQTTPEDMAYVDELTALLEGEVT